MDLDELANPPVVEVCKLSRRQSPKPALPVAGILYATPCTAG